MTTWFASDHHFGHTNIIKFANRPFQSVDEMNSEMLKRHNAVVQNSDDIYLLGDFAFCDPRIYLPKLKGRKHLILGNHDQSRVKHLHDPGNHLIWIKEVALIEVQSQVIFLSHYPHRSWPNSFHGSWHLFGHVHGLLDRHPRHGRSVDVGVDCWDYGPVSFETLEQTLSDQKPYPA